MSEYENCGIAGPRHFCCPFGRKDFEPTMKITCCAPGCCRPRPSRCNCCQVRCCCNKPKCPPKPPVCDKCHR